MKKNLKKILSGVLAFALIVQPLTVNAADYITDASVFEAEPLDITTEEVSEAKIAFSDDLENSGDLVNDSEIISFSDSASEKTEILNARNNAEIFEKGTCGDHLTWTLNTQWELTISGSGKMNNYHECGPWGHIVKSVDIKKGVTSIGDYAFKGCVLTKVSIPDSVTSIGWGAFWSCMNLPEVKIPNSVTSIDSYSFAQCDKLTSIAIPDSVTNVGEFVLMGCKNLESVKISNHITMITAGMFHKCDDLKSIKMPDGIKEIDTWAFANCTGLKRVRIPAGVTSIGPVAFEGCTGLTEIEIPNSVTDSYMSSFDGCSNLTDVYYGGTENEWKGMTFLSKSLDKATIHYDSKMPYVDSSLAFDEEACRCKLGETFALTAEYISEDQPENIHWECNDVNAVKFSRTSTQGPAETGKKNTWWISTMITGKARGKYKIVLSVGAISKKIDLTIQSDGNEEETKYKMKLDFSVKKKSSTRKTVPCEIILRLFSEYEKKTVKNITVELIPPEAATVDKKQLKKTISSIVPGKQKTLKWSSVLPVCPRTESYEWKCTVSCDSLNPKVKRLSEQLKIDGNFEKKFQEIEQDYVKQEKKMNTQARKVIDNVMDIYADGKKHAASSLSKELETILASNLPKSAEKALLGVFTDTVQDTLMIKPSTYSGCKNAAQLVKKVANQIDDKNGNFTFDDQKITYTVKFKSINTSGASCVTGSIRSSKGKIYTFLGTTIKKSDIREEMNQLKLFADSKIEDAKKAILSDAAKMIVPAEFSNFLKTTSKNKAYNLLKKWSPEIANRVKKGAEFAKKFKEATDAFSKLKQIAYLKDASEDEVMKQITDYYKKIQAFTKAVN